MVFYFLLGLSNTSITDLFLDLDMVQVNLPPFCTHTRHQPVTICSSITGLLSVVVQNRLWKDFGKIFIMISIKFDYLRTSDSVFIERFSIYDDLMCSLSSGDS